MAKGWHGDSAGHARAAKKRKKTRSSSVTKKLGRRRAKLTTYTKKLGRLGYITGHSWSG